MMGLGNKVIMTQVTLYLLMLIFSLFVIIPLSVNLDDFRGNCLLYADGLWTDTTLTITDWGDKGTCNFPIFVGVILLISSFTYMIWMSYFLLRESEASWLFAFASVIISCIITLLLAVGGGVVTQGTKDFCKTIEQMLDCEAADYESFLSDKLINTRHFYVEMGMAQFGLWASFICSAVQIGTHSYTLYEYHQQEDFTVSISRERERLLQRVSHDRYDDTW